MGTGSATPTAVATGSATPTTVATGSATPTAVGTGSATPTAVATGSVTPTAVGTGSATPSPTPGGENHPPNAEDDTATTKQDTSVDIPVLANDSDQNGDILKVATLSQAGNGRVVSQPDGTLRYTPNSGYTGADRFTYTIHDGRGKTDSATVTITVNAVNPPPNAVNRTANTNEDTPGNIPAVGNHNNRYHRTLIVSSVSQGQHGTVSINSDNTINYMPDPDYNGVDDFTYTVEDAHGSSKVAMVDITVNPVHDEPSAIPDAIIVENVENGTEVVLKPLNNDINPDQKPLQIIDIGQPSHGTIQLNPDQTLTYMPKVDFQGTDHFTYTIDYQNTRRGNLEEKTTEVVTTVQTFTVVVNPEEGLIVGEDDSIRTEEDLSVTSAVLKNDQNNGSESGVSVLGVSGGEGLVMINEDNTISYSPAANANGHDSFSYIVGDGKLGADTVVVSATINAVNDAPHAVRDMESTEEDTPVTINVLSNDNDLDGDSISLKSVTQGSHGNVTINPDQTLSYTPKANFNGTDTFAYTIQDMITATDVAVVTISVSEVDDAPDAGTDLVMTEQGTPIKIQLLENDIDVEGNPLTITTITLANKGSVIVHNDGYVTYIPNPDYIGVDTFTYTVTDGHLSSSANVIITIIPPVSEGENIFYYLPIIANEAFSPPNPG